MLDLEKLEKDIDRFLAGQTAESYSEIFKILDEEQLVKLSGGYTEQFECPSGIIVNQTSTIEITCDFSGDNYNMAA
jgi:hypothetical protein